MSRQHRSAGMLSIRRAQAVSNEIKELSARTREIIAESLEVLKTPIPDLFLGRKTHELLPPTE